MKKMHSTTSIARSLLAALVVLANYVIGSSGFLPVVFAEEPQFNEPQAAAPESGEVSERGVDVRDQRSSAPPPPQPAQSQQGTNSPYQIVLFDTAPENFKANMFIDNFIVWVGCRPGLTVGSPDCPNLPGVTLEIWHTQPGQQPILLSMRQNVSFIRRDNRQIEGVNLHAFMPEGVPGARLVNPGGFFTVKLLRGAVVLAQRLFDVVPFEWTVRNPRCPTVVDHRTNR